MLAGVTRHILPHLSGVPHLHVNRPLVNRAKLFERRLALTWG